MGREASSHSSPRTAFILAAGFGTRMAPLTAVRPKALLPVWNETLLQRAVSLVRSWGVERIIINAHHQAGQVARAAKHLAGPGLDVACSVESEILGTGGALWQARDLLPDEPFWLLNADVLARLDPQPLLRAFAARRPLAVLWLHETLGPRTVTMKNGRVLDFHVKNPGARGTYTFTGLHLVAPDLLRFIPAGGFSSIIDAYKRAMKAGEVISGVVLPGAAWHDVGTPERYLEAHRAGTPGGAAECIATGTGTRIGRGSVLRDVVAWDRVRVAGNSQLERCILADGCRIYRPLHAHSSLFVPAHAVLRSCEGRAARKVLGGEVTAEQLPARGSSRSFFRLHAPSQNLVLVRYDAAARPENARYARHATWLARRGVPVPAVLFHSRKSGFMLMADAGSRDLKDMLGGSSETRIEKTYRRVLDAVALLHTRCTVDAARARIPLEEPFTDALYAWEHDLFLSRFLAPRLKLTVRDRRALQEELDWLKDALKRQPQVLVHRDLQSSNVLFNGRRLALIDFQGMRLGPAGYDLASLLADPYVSLPHGLQLRLLAYYNGRPGVVPLSKTAFRLAAVQRLMQALGAFGRLGSDPATCRFLAHIPPALVQLRRALPASAPLKKLLHLIQRLDPEDK